MFVFQLKIVGEERKTTAQVVPVPVVKITKENMIRNASDVERARKFLPSGIGFSGVVCPVAEFLAKPLAESLSKENERFKYDKMYGPQFAAESQERIISEIKASLADIVKTVVSLPTNLETKKRVFNGLFKMLENKDFAKHFVEVPGSYSYSFKTIGEIAGAQALLTLCEPSVAPSFANYSHMFSNLPVFTKSNTVKAFKELGQRLAEMEKRGNFTGSDLINIESEVERKYYMQKQL